MLDEPKQWMQLNEGRNSAVGHSPRDGGAGLLPLRLGGVWRAGWSTGSLFLLLWGFLNQGIGVGCPIVELYDNTLFILWFVWIYIFNYLCCCILEHLRHVCYFEFAGQTPDVNVSQNSAPQHLIILLDLSNVFDFELPAGYHVIPSLLRIYILYNSSVVTQSITPSSLFNTMSLSSPSAIPHLHCYI